MVIRLIFQEGQMGLSLQKNPLTCAFQGGGGNGQLPAGLDVGREKTGGEGHARNRGAG